MFDLNLLFPATISLWQTAASQTLAILMAVSARRVASAFTTITPKCSISSKSTPNPLGNSVSTASECCTKRR